MNIDLSNVKLLGRVTIIDAETGNVDLDKMNAVHPQNMATLIARSLARDSNGSIFKMAFGNGGTFVNSSSQIVYRPPNTLGAATLYNQTYFTPVDEQEAGTPETNTVTSSVSPAPAITSIVTVTALIADGAVTSPYTFDELGLFTGDDLLLSHLIFTPITKSSGSAKLVVYEILISVS